MPPDLEINEGRMKILSDIGNQVGIAIENAKLYEETKALSLHDALTGLANRRMLDVIFERSFIRARRFASPLSVLMLDIDHFKNIMTPMAIWQGTGCFVKLQMRPLKKYGKQTLLLDTAEKNFLFCCRRQI